MKATLLLFLALALTALCEPVEIKKEKVGDPVYDFLEGFLEGLNEKGDVNKLLECIKDIGPISLDIMKALQLIAKFNPKDMFYGIVLLIHAIKELTDAMEPCNEGFTQLQKFTNAIKHADIKKLLARIASDPNAFLKDINTCIEAFEEGDYYTFAKALGDMMYKLFLQEGQISMDLNAFALFTEGFLEGMGHGHVYVGMEDCVREVPEVYQDVMLAIKNLKETDWKNLESIVKAFSMFVDSVRHLLETIKPCSAAPEEVNQIIQKFAQIDVEKLQMKILMNTVQILADFTSALNKIRDLKYQEGGIAFGDIVYLVIFKE